MSKADTLAAMMQESMVHSVQSAQRTIETITSEILELKKQAGKALLGIGQRLIEAKETLPHGEWLPWLTERVEFSERTAQYYMQLAREWTNPQSIADLGATKAFKLLALPAEEREAFIQERNVVDMFACYWFAIDFDDRVWVYREYCESGLIVSEAAAAMRRLTPPEEHIQFTVAPPDMWTTQKDTGRTMAEVFMQNGIGLVSASNQRVQGWMIVKEFLKVRQDGKPGMVIFKDCRRLILNLPALQHDEKNPSDCAKEPHDITHSPDAIRYGLIYRTMGARLEPVKNMDDDDDYMEEYDDFMTGGDATDGYMSYGG